VGGLAQIAPDSVDTIDFDKAVRLVAETSPEYGIVRDEEAVAEIRRQRAEMQAEAMKQQKMRNEAGALRDLTGAERNQSAPEKRMREGGEAYARQS